MASWALAWLALLLPLAPVVSGQVPAANETQLVLAAPATLNATTYWSGASNGEGGTLTILVATQQVGPLVTVAGEDWNGSSEASVLNCLPAGPVLRIPPTHSAAGLPEPCEAPECGWVQETSA